MATTTTYKCDKCGAEQATADQFWHISVLLTSKPLGYSSAYPSATRKIEVCRACVLALGLLPPSIGDGTKAPVPPTTEELILKVLARCGVEPQS